MLDRTVNMFLLPLRENCSLNVCSYHVMYAFQSESALYSCKCLSVRLWTKRLWVRVQLQSLKSVHVQSFSGPYFPALGLNARKCENGKMRTRRSPNTDTFHAVYMATNREKFCGDYYNLSDYNCWYIGISILAFMITNYLFDFAEWSYCTSVTLPRRKIFV